MTSTLSVRAMCSVTMLLLLSEGCLDFSGLALPVACGAVASARGLGEGIGAALGAPARNALRDDEGNVVRGVDGRCAIDACEPRIAQVGTKIELHVDVNALAGARMVSPATAQAALVSTDPEVIAVHDGKAVADSCNEGSFLIDTSVSFEKEGQAALVVQQGDDELARFSFEVAQAASLQVNAMPGLAPSSLQIDGTDEGTRAVRGAINVGVALRVQAHAADGRVMLLDSSARSTIDDPNVARFALSMQPDTTFGVKLLVGFLAEGSTTLRTEVGNLTTLVELHADPSLPTPQPSAAGTTP